MGEKKNERKKRDERGKKEGEGSGPSIHISGHEWCRTKRTWAINLEMEWAKKNFVRINKLHKFFSKQPLFMNSCKLLS